MSNCITCSNDPVPPCSCSSDQQCIRINQSCNECAHNICQAVDGTQSGGSNAGATAGGAVGGAAAGIVLVALVWMFYRKRSGRSLPSLFPARFLKHSRSSSRDLGAHEMADTPSRPMSRALDNRASRLSKRVSVHPDDDQAGADPFADDAGAAASVARASQIAPITASAYQPPDANSMSLEDGHQRTALGVRRSTSNLGPAAATAVAKKPSIKAKGKAISLRPGHESSQVEDPDSRFSASTFETGYTGIRSLSALSSAIGDLRPASAMSTASAASSHASVLIDPPELVTLASSAKHVEMTRATPVVLQTSPRKAGKKRTAPESEDPFADAASDMLDEALGRSALVGQRPLTSLSRASGISVPESSRASLFPGETSSVRTPSTASFSALDGIPFMSSAAIPESATLPKSPFPRAPARTSAADASRPVSAASFATSPTSVWSKESHIPALPTPRPASSAAGTVRGLSIADFTQAGRPESALSAPEDVTRRSGFSSGGALSGVPFHLAFPGERDSRAMSDRTSTLSEMPEIATARVSYVHEPVASMPEDPFADSHAAKASSDRISLASIADLVAEIDQLED